MKPKESDDDGADKSWVPGGSRGKQCYLLRAGTRKCYRDLETPEDDTFVYCDNCHELYEDDCPTHPLTIIEDSVVPSTGKCNRAKISLPPGLVVKEAGIEEAGEGVWTEKFFHKGSRFGPYGGEIVDENVGRRCGYAWEILSDKKKIFINGENKGVSNWLRYVNCARNEAEQNLIAYQHRGQIYYRSFKPIPPGTELLVYYGKEYAKELGIVEDEPKNGHGAVAQPHRGHVAVAQPHRAHNLLGLLANFGDSDDKGLDEDAPTLRQTKGDRCCKSCTPQHSPEPADRVDTNCSLHAATVTSATATAAAAAITKSARKPAAAAAAAAPAGPHNNGNVDGDHLCQLCGKEFTAKCFLLKHLKYLHQQHINLAPCEGVTGNSSSKFQGVSQEESNRRRSRGMAHKCNLCDYTSAWAGNVKRHQRTHTGDKPNKCTHCNKCFTTSGNCKIHEKTHTGDTPFHCDICDYSCGRLESLQTHRRTHTGEKPYQCKKCQKHYTTTSNLRQHERTHTGVRPYKCCHCRYSCAIKSGLTIHERTHTGEKPYKCRWCPQRCRYSNTLKRHERKHVGIKPYQCKECKETYTSWSNLRAHQRTHTGEKPYKCTRCAYTCTTSSNLKVHERTHRKKI